jgi:hypothetical protein
VAQIWVANVPKFDNFENIRLREPLDNRHPHFKTWTYNNTKGTYKYFDKQKYKWDFAVVRQGYYDYSELITDPKLLKTNRQYLFVKIKNPIAKKIFKLLDFTELSNSNTSVKGFSNTDLVAKYTELCNKEFLN